MAIAPVPAFPFPRRPFSSITPFTYSDAMTHLELLEKLRVYAGVTLPDEINKVLDDYSVEITAEVQAAIDMMIGTLNDKIIEIDDALADQQADYTQKISDLTVYVDDAVQQIINSAIEVQDPVVAGIVNDDDSLSRQAILDATNPNTILIYSGADDTFAWQSAVDAVIADRASGAIAPETVITIRGMSPAYEFSEAVRFRGLTNTVIKGAADGYATITPAVGGGSMVLFQC